VLTLGCTAPLFIHEARRVMIGSTRYGTESFRYDGEPRDLLIIYLRGILLSILTIGIYIPWMRAQEQRYIWGRTFFMNAQGHCDLSGWLLLRLTLLNLLGSALSLGLALPWIATYSARRVCQSVSFHGHIEFASIGQTDGAVNATGDALA